MSAMASCTIKAQPAADAGAWLWRALVLVLALFLAAETIDLATAVAIPQSTLSQIEINPFMVDLMGATGSIAAAVAIKLVVWAGTMAVCAFLWRGYGRAVKIGVVAILFAGAAVNALFACSNILNVVR